MELICLPCLGFLDKLLWLRPHPFLGSWLTGKSALHCRLKINITIPITKWNFHHSRYFSHMGCYRYFLATWTWSSCSVCANILFLGSCFQQPLISDRAIAIPLFDTQTLPFDNKFSKSPYEMPVPDIQSLRLLNIICFHKEAQENLWKNAVNDMFTEGASAKSPLKLA